MPKLTMVTSDPSRQILALPKGMVKSSPFGTSELSP